MYPHKLAKEIVELLTRSHSRAWDLVSSTFYLPTEALVVLFQKDQKLWNKLKYSLGKLTPQLVDDPYWELVLSQQSRAEASLRAELMAYAGIAAFVDWAKDQDMYTDQLDLFRYTKRPLSGLDKKSQDANDCVPKLDLDISNF